MNKISPAREAAYRILMEVERGQAHADDLLRARFVNKLAAADRNLTTALVLGTLRWQTRLDERIRTHLAKPNARLDAEVRIALRLAALQMIEMERIPAHAAIGESVELAKQAGHSFAARMVNAVLRKLAAEIDAEQAAGGDSPNPAAAGADDAQPTAASLAQRYAHPLWLVERWVAQYGDAAAETLCAHGQRQAALCLRLEDFTVEDELLLDDVELGPGSLLTEACTVAAGDPTRSAAFQAGRARVQDEGSQLVAELAAAAAPAGSKQVCDACAAPGGKTLVLAEQLPQAQILACELSQPRAAALAKRLASLGKRVRVAQMDAAELGTGSESGFDLVLVDAPCTGTGTMGRNPEIRHRLQPEEFARQAERQTRILTAALKAVRVGGRVIYSTCSLEREENEAVVAAALAARPDARQISAAEAIDVLGANGQLLPGAADVLKQALTAEGALRILPGAAPTDGFFIAALERFSGPISAPETR